MFGSFFIPWRKIVKKSANGLQTVNQNEFKSATRIYKTSMNARNEKQNSLPIHLIYIYYKIFTNDIDKNNFY